MKRKAVCLSLVGIVAVATLYFWPFPSRPAYPPPSSFLLPAPVKPTSPAAPKKSQASVQQAAVFLVTPLDWPSATADAQTLADKSGRDVQPVFQADEHWPCCNPCDDNGAALMCANAIGNILRSQPDTSIDVVAFWLGAVIAQRALVILEDELAPEAREELLTRVRVLVVGGSLTAAGHPLARLWPEYVDIQHIAAAGDPASAYSAIMRQGIVRKDFAAQYAPVRTSALKALDPQVNDNVQHYDEVTKALLQVGLERLAPEAIPTDDAFRIVYMRAIVDALANGPAASPDVWRLNERVNVEVAYNRPELLTSDALMVDVTSSITASGPAEGGLVILARIGSVHVSEEPIVLNGEAKLICPGFYRMYVYSPGAFEPGATAVVALDVSQQFSARETECPHAEWLLTNSTTPHDRQTPLSTTPGYRLASQTTDQIKPPRSLLLVERPTPIDAISEIRSANYALSIHLARLAEMHPGMRVRALRLMPEIAENILGQLDVNARDSLARSLSQLIPQELRPSEQTQQSSQLPSPPQMAMLRGAMNWVNETALWQTVIDELDSLSTNDASELIVVVGADDQSFTKVHSMLPKRLRERVERQDFPDSPPPAAHAPSVPLHRVEALAREFMPTFMGYEGQRSLSVQEYFTLLTQHPISLEKDLVKAPQVGVGTFEWNNAINWTGALELKSDWRETYHAICKSKTPPTIYVRLREKARHTSGLDSHTDSDCYWLQFFLLFPYNDADTTPGNPYQAWNPAFLFLESIGSIAVGDEFDHEGDWVCVEISLEDINNPKSVRKVVVHNHGRQFVVRKCVYESHPKLVDSSPGWHPKIWLESGTNEATPVDGGKGGSEIEDLGIDATYKDPGIVEPCYPDQRHMIHEHRGDQQVVHHSTARLVVLPDVDANCAECMEAMKGIRDAAGDSACLKDAFVRSLLASDYRYGSSESRTKALEAAWIHAFSGPWGNSPESPQAPPHQGKMWSRAWGRSPEPYVLDATGWDRFWAELGCTLLTLQVLALGIGMLVGLAFLCWPCALWVLLVVCFSLSAGSGGGDGSSGRGSAFANVTKDGGKARGSPDNAPWPSTGGGPAPQRYWTRYLGVEDGKSVCRWWWVEDGNHGVQTDAAIHGVQIPDELTNRYSQSLYQIEKAGDNIVAANMMFWPKSAADDTGPILLRVDRSGGKSVCDVFKPLINAWGINEQIPEDLRNHILIEPGDLRWCQLRGATGDWTLEVADWDTPTTVDGYKMPPEWNISQADLQASLGFRLKADPGSRYLMLQLEDKYVVCEIKDGQIARVRIPDEGSPRAALDALIKTFGK